LNESQDVVGVVAVEGRGAGAVAVHAYVGLLERLVANEQQAIRFNGVLAAVILAVGILTPVLSQYFVAKDPKWLTAAGGAVVSGLSAFPLKIIFNKKDRISACIALRGLVESIPPAGPTSDFHRQALEQCRQLLEKLLRD
jgi:hypothetical protein